MRFATLLAILASFLLSLPALADQGSDPSAALRRAALDREAARLYAPSLEAAPAAGNGGPPSLILILAPGYDYAGHSAIEGVVGNTALKSRSGHSHTANLVLRLIKPLGEVVSLGLFYQIAYGDYSGGLMVPASGGPPGFSFDGWSDVRVVSNVIGLTADFNIGRLGKIETAALYVYETFRGNETMVLPFDHIETRTASNFKDKVLSFTAFWSKDIEAGQGLTLTPYLGWRSLRVTLVNQTDWEAPDGSYYPDSSSWAHFGAAGLKAVYHAGLWSFSGRLGVSHRFSKSDIPGFASRAMAPGVTHLGWQAAWDKTVASWGLGVGYVIPGKVIIDVGYNGLVGADTNAHALSVGLIFPF